MSKRTKTKKVGKTPQLFEAIRCINMWTESICASTYSNGRNNEISEKR
jgi:hypothetical protein